MLNAASTFRRSTAWLVDYLVVVVPGGALVVTALSFMLHSLPGYFGAVAAQYGWAQLMRLFTPRGVASLGAAAATEWLAFAAPLIIALLVVPLLQFLYQTLFLVWRKRTIGMMLAGITVAGVSNVDSLRLRRRSAIARAFSTTALETGILSLALVIVTIGEFVIGMIVWAAAIVAFWINALTALSPRRRTIIDRLCATAVVRRPRDVKARAAELAGMTSSAAITAGQKASDATAVVAQLAQEGAHAAVESAPVQLVLNSRAGQQAQNLGSRARELWQARQAKRATPVSESPVDSVDQALPPV